jgi:acyl carrier protein
MKNKIKATMKEVFGEEIPDDFSKESSDKWDSLMHLDLIVKLEDEFNVSFTPDEIGSIESYRDVEKILSEKIKAEKNEQ